MRTTRGIATIVLVLISAFAVHRLARAQTSEVEFIPETGHSLRGVGQFDFNFAGQDAGVVIPIELTVNFQGIIGKSKTPFRIWY